MECNLENAFSRAAALELQLLENARRKYRAATDPLMILLPLTPTRYIIIIVRCEQARSAALHNYIQGKGILNDANNLSAGSSLSNLISTIGCVVVVHLTSLAIVSMVQFWYEYYASASLIFHRLWRWAFQGPRSKVQGPRCTRHSHTAEHVILPESIESKHEISSSSSNNNNCRLIVYESGRNNILV